METLDWSEFDYNACSIELSMIKEVHPLHQIADIAVQMSCMWVQDWESGDIHSSKWGEITDHTSWTLCPNQPEKEREGRVVVAG